MCLISMLTHVHTVTLYMYTVSAVHVLHVFTNQNQYLPIFVYFPVGARRSMPERKKEDVWRLGRGRGTQLTLFIKLFLHRIF